MFGKIAAIILCAIAASMCFANAGFFGGAGANITLSKTDKIQLQSEVVRITPQEFDFKMPMNLSKLWFAKYHCTFVLKNLTGENVSTQVAFPLQEIRAKNFYSDKNFRAYSTSKINSKPKRYSPKRIPSDSDKRFDGLYAWEMDFSPNETLELTVEYELSGYLGAGAMSDFPPPDDYFFHQNNEVKKLDYLSVLENCLIQAFSYITVTGGSWAGEIERAEFVFNTRGFDKSLARGYPLTFGKQNEFCSMLLDGWILRNTKPNGESRDGIIRKAFEPFKPQEQPFYIAYYFSVIPKNIKCFEILHKQAIEKSKEKWFAKKHPTTTATVEKDLADAILEFHGVATGNRRIIPFLKRQFWYPANEKRPIDDELKKKLLKYSHGTDKNR